MICILIAIALCLSAMPVLASEGESIGDLYGYLSLGTLYEEGLGAEQDYEKAEEYCRIAADMGVQEAA